MILALVISSCVLASAGALIWKLKKTKSEKCDCGGNCKCKPEAVSVETPVVEAPVEQKEETIPVAEIPKEEVASEKVKKAPIKKKPAKKRKK
jgi:hypothetical protein